MRAIQMTWDMLDEKQCEQKEPYGNPKGVCWHGQCTESNGVKCCRGCVARNRCQSRCIYSMRIFEYDPLAEERLMHNGLEMMNHNQGMMVLAEGEVVYFMKEEEKK